jgi:hypothetical protein
MVGDSQMLLESLRELAETQTGGQHLHTYWLEKSGVEPGNCIFLKGFPSD